MFTAAPLTIAKTWKQGKCPLSDEQIKKMKILVQKDTFTLMFIAAFFIITKIWKSNYSLMDE